MMAEIIVSHGLCSAIRPKVMTALKPYHFKDLRIQAWGEGRYGTDDTTTHTSDDNKMAATHYARIMVSDDAAAWAEWLLWRSGDVSLESKPLNPHLNWIAPKNCKDATRGENAMPIPWDQQKRQPRAKVQQAPPAKRKARKPAAQKGGMFAGALVLRGRQQRRSR